MAAQQKDAAIHKRQLIDHSGRVMFGWVAGASVIVGFALVISWFLVQQIMYKDKVVSEMNKTVATLNANNKAAPRLSENIRVLETNAALNSAKANPDQKALQVILDALPADKNTLALGASLQQRLVGGVSNVTIESLDVEALAGESVATVGSVEPMYFSMTIASPDPNAIKEVLKRFEASVRLIEVDNIRLEQSESRMSATIQAHAFFLPEKSLELTKKTVRPN